MEPNDDPKLSELLKEWQVSGAPPSLDSRMLSPRKKWWSFLLTGSIPVPMPVTIAVAIALVVMAVALMRGRPAPPVDSSISLVEFRPVEDLNVRVIRGYEAN